MMFIEGVLQNEDIGAVIHPTHIQTITIQIRPLNHYIEIMNTSITFLNTMRKFGIKILFHIKFIGMERSTRADNSISETNPCKPIGSFGESTLMFETILKNTR